MTFKKIVGFGDSWMWGDELLSPELVDHPQAHPILMENTEYRESHCFLGLLGQHYNVPTVNFGWPGGSLQSAIWCYLWWLEHSDDVDETLVLVGHTDANRHSFYNPAHVSYANDPPWNKFVHSSWIHSGNKSRGDDWTDMIKQHMVLTDCQELEILNFKQSVEFFQGQHAIRKMPVIQFSIAPPPVTVQVQGLITSSECLADILRQPKFKRPVPIFKSGGHPTEIGHEIIRDYLISHIDDAIINGC
jgi:hypothetical protein